MMCGRRCQNSLLSVVADSSDSLSIPAIHNGSIHKDNSFQKYLLDIRDRLGIDQAALGDLNSAFLKEVSEGLLTQPGQCEGRCKGDRAERVCLRRWYLGWVWAAPGTVGTGAGEVKLAVGAQKKVQKCDVCVCVRMLACVCNVHVHVYMYVCVCAHVHVCTSLVEGAPCGFNVVTRRQKRELLSPKHTTCF